MLLRYDLDLQRSFLVCNRKQTDSTWYNRGGMGRGMWIHKVRTVMKLHNEKKSNFQITIALVSGLIRKKETITAALYSNRKKILIWCWRLFLFALPTIEIWYKIIQNWFVISTTYKMYYIINWLMPHKCKILILPNYTILFYFILFLFSKMGKIKLLKRIFSTFCH